jgi:hypothetical protein
VAIGRGGVKSLKNARQTGPNTTETCAKMAAEKPRQPSSSKAEFKQSRIRAKPNSSKANFAGGWSDQALALLSTARSERSA